MPTSQWHGFPLYKVNALATFAHELKSFADLIPPEAPLADLRPSLERILQYSTAKDEVKAEMGSAVPELTGDLIGFFLLDYASALAMVCRDKYGFISKENEFGNHPVRAMGGIHFKPNPKGLDFLGVAEEFMVHSLGEIISGSRTITAPTSLLKVSHIPMVKVSKHPKKNREAYKTLMDSMVKGVSAGQCFEENPALFNSVEKKAKDFSTVIQAGLSIDGVLLLHLLEALQNLEFLVSRLVCTPLSKLLNSTQTAPTVLEVLPRLMSDCYQSDLFDDYSHFRGSFNPSLLYESYLGFSATLSPDERFVEFQQLDAADSRREHVFMKLCKRNRSGMLAAFALVKKFPSLMKGAYLSDLQRLPASLALLQTLLPDSTPEQILAEAPKLLDCIDMHSFSAIYVLSLLTSPSDGKADNYMVQLEREAGKGNVKCLRIVGIDNDKAFEPPVRTNKLGQIYPGLKSIILCLPNAALPIDPKFRAALLSLTPEMIILQWLAELHEQNQRYARMENLGIIEESDKVEKKTATKTLDIPITIQPQVLQGVFDKLLLVHRMLTNDASCSHRKLLEAVEPLLARYYQQVMQTTKSPLEAQRSIYHGDYMTVGAASTSLSEEAFNLAGVRSPTIVLEKPPTLPPLESVIKEFVAKIELGNLDPVSPSFRSILVIFTTKLPFVKRLPFNTLQLDRFLLHTAQNSDDSDLSLVESVLRAGANAGALDDFGRTPLHCLFSRSSPLLPIGLIKRLLAEKVPLEEKDAAGQKPLHYLLRHLNTDGATPATQALALMLQAGADIDGEDAGGDSIIRQAIKRDLPSAFARLALLGAGRQLLVTEVKPFVEKHVALEEWKKEMRDVCKALVKVNHAVAIEYGIRSLLTPLSSANPEIALSNVVIGLESGKGVLRAETADRLFDSPETARPDSTSFVYLTPYDQTVLCNNSPRHPFMELFGHQLAIRLFGYSSPQCELFRAERTGSATLVYQHVDGFNYSAVLSDAEKRDSMMKNIDMACFSEIVLLHLITMQEVQREDLYLVPHFSSKLRLFSLRNRGVVPEVAVKRGSDWAVMHRNYTFCMDQFTSPLDPVVRARFLALDVGKTLSACFTDMVTLQKRCEDLFGIERTLAMNLPYRLGIVAVALQRRMQVLQTAVADNPASTSMLDLLGKVSHMLSAFYRSAFKARKTPDARYEFLAEKTLANAVEESYVLPVELYFNQPLFDLPFIVPEEWVGRVDFKQELIFLSRVLSSTRTVRQLSAQLNTGQAEMSLIGALDDEAKARLLYRFNWTCLTEEKQKLLFDGLFPRNGSWSLKSLYLDSYASLDTETLAQSLRQERGNQLLEISLTSLPQLDVHKIISEISRKAPNIEKLRLVRIGTRTAASTKGSLETASAEPGKLMRFASVKQILLAECYRLEFLRIWAPELRILELTACEKLLGFEIVSQDQKENRVAHTNLTSLSIVRCANVAQSYVEHAVMNCPSLRAVRFSDFVASNLMAYYFSLYNTWSPMNVALLCADSTLNLSGSCVTDAMIDKIIPFISTTRIIDLSGCTNVTSQAISAIVASCPTVEIIRLASVTPPEEKSTRATGTTCIQLLPSGRLMTGHADGQIRMWDVGSELVEKKEGSKLHSDAVTLAENGPFGQIACGSVDRAVTVLQSNVLVDKFESSSKLKGHDAAIRAARFMPDGTLVTVSTDRAVKVWEVSSGKVLRAWPGDSTKNSFQVVEFLSNIKIVGGGEGALLCFFAVDTGKEYKQVISDNGSVHAIRTLSPEMFASAGANGRVKVWQSATGECLFTMTGHTGTVRGLEKMPLSRMASYTDNTVRVWDYTTGVCLNTVPFNTISLTNLRCLPDGRLVLSTAQSLMVCSLAHPIYGRGCLNLPDLDFLRGVRFAVEPEGVDSLAMQFAEARNQDVFSISTSLSAFLRPLIISETVKLTPFEDKIVLGPLVPPGRRQDLQVLLEGIALRQKDRNVGRKLRVSAWNVTRLQITGPSAAASSGSNSASLSSDASPPISPSSSPKGLQRTRSDGGRLSIVAYVLLCVPSKSPSPPQSDAGAPSSNRKNSPALRSLAASVFFGFSPTETSVTRGVSPLKMPASAPVPIPSPPNSPPREQQQGGAAQPRPLSPLQRSQSRGAELYNRAAIPSSVSTSPSPSPNPVPQALDPRPKASPSPARSPFDTPPSTASALEHTSDAQPSSWVPKKTPTQAFLRGVKGIRSSSDPQLGAPTPAPASLVSSGSPSSSSPLASASGSSGGSDRQNPEQTVSPREPGKDEPKPEQPKLAAVRMTMGARRVGSERMEKFEKPTS